MLNLAVQLSCVLGDGRVIAPPPCGRVVGLLRLDGAEGVAGAHLVAGQRLAVDVGVELGGRQLRVGLRLLDGCLHCLLHRHVDDLRGNDDTGSTVTDDMMTL